MTPVIFITIGFLSCWFLLYALVEWTQDPQRKSGATRGADKEINHREHWNHATGEATLASGIASLPVDLNLESNNLGRCNLEIRKSTGEWNSFPLFLRRRLERLLRYSLSSTSER